MSDKTPDSERRGEAASLAIRPAPGVVQPELAPLLHEPFASAFATGPEPAAGPASPAPRLRERLAARVQRSHQAEAAMVNVRWKRLPTQALAPGVTARTLYLADDAGPQRRGEPLRVRLLDLAVGQPLDAAMLGEPQALQATQREWLVMSGTVLVDGQTLGERDYHRVPAGAPTPVFTALEPARLFLREARGPADRANASDQPLTVRDAEAGWPEFAPGIRRRVLWQAQGQAAMLYHAEPGAMVPHHTHGHDEECLMVQGELFLDDLLLQPGDYQLAPQGTGHQITHTDTGVVIYAHGDLDLQFVGV
ncbi:MAG: cupin domain-containing protein [Rubrivivax sp.]|nr:cupin domain-containing protein [Rubrivivax sp.]